MKTICHEISNLDLIVEIGDIGTKRVIIHDLRLQYRGFAATVYKWLTEPSLVEFVNFLTDQEAMIK